MNKNQIELFGQLIFLGKEDEVKKAISSGVDLSCQISNEMTFLIAAVEGDQPIILELLLENGANPNQKSTLSGMTALHWAVEYAHDGMVQNNRKQPYKESLKCIEILLRYNADQNLKDDNGKIPLDYSSSEKIRELFK